MDKVRRYLLREEMALPVANRPFRLNGNGHIIVELLDALDEAEAAVPKHLLVALSQLQRAVEDGNLGALSTINEHLQPVADAFMAKLRQGNAELEARLATAHKAIVLIPKNAKGITDMDWGAVNTFLAEYE